jgi:hypothetical protein
MVEEPLTPGEILLKNDLMKKYEDLNWNVKQEKYFKKVNYCNDY